MLRRSRAAVVVGRLLPVLCFALWTGRVGAQTAGGSGTVAAPSEVGSPTAAAVAPPVLAPPAMAPPVRAVAAPAPDAPAFAPFEFHGYLRSGFGVSSQHTKQEAFYAPGAGVRGGPPTKYRLGNETETYGEAALVNNWLNPDKSDGATFKTQLLLAFVAFNNANFDASNLLTIREAFGEAAGVIPGARAVKFWAGQRFYMRHDVHITDFYFLDTSGYGGGVYDIPVAGTTKLAVAYIGGSTSDPALKLGRGFAARSMIDLRLSDLEVLTGKLTVWLAGATVRGGPLSPAADGSARGEMPSVTGGAVGLVHKIDGVLGGFQQLSLQFGNGPMTDFNSYYKPTVDRIRSGSDAGNALVQSAWRFRLVEALQIQPNERFSMMGTAVAQLSDFGVEGGKGQETWLSVGARPVFHFTRHLSLAVEGGLDYVSSQFSSSGVVTKLTVAPQVATANLFWARPVLRAYVTGAYWSAGLKGLVGGMPFANSQLGLSAGLQVESWW
jgi:maltoporin